MTSQMLIHPFLGAHFDHTDAHVRPALGAHYLGAHFTGVFEHVSNEHLKTVNNPGNPLGAPGAQLPRTNEHVRRHGLRLPVYGRAMLAAVSG
jgi:hypothetical protein